MCLITRHSLLLLDMTCGRDSLDCQVIPGCFQHVPDTRTGEREEELLDTAERASILKLTEGVLVCEMGISWLEVAGQVVSLHSNLTVCKEGCSPLPAFYAILSDLQKSQARVTTMISFFRWC